MEQTDIDALACRVLELIKPEIAAIAKEKQYDPIFDVDSLSQYLGVKTSWVYKQVSRKPKSQDTIPFFKAGKYIRFKKRRIDKWIEAQMISPFGKIGG